VETPAAALGDVLADLQRRQGRISAIGEEGGRQLVAALAPLAQLSGYATALRSLSQGRAAATVQFGGYEAVRAGAATARAA
jgi:elongation factor G